MHAGTLSRAGQNNKHDISNSYVGGTKHRDKNGDNDCDDDSREDLSSAQPQKRGLKRRSSPSLQELEDTDDDDDDDDDDTSWMNTPSVLSLSTQSKRK